MNETHMPTFPRKLVGHGNKVENIEHSDHHLNRNVMFSGRLMRGNMTVTKYREKVCRRHMTLEQFIFQRGIHLKHKVKGAMASKQQCQCPGVVVLGSRSQFTQLFVARLKSFALLTIPTQI